MKVTACVSALLGLLQFCSSDDAPPPMASVPSAIGGESKLPPAHGGKVVDVGRYPMEVTAHRSGQVYAYARTEMPAPDEAEVLVKVSTERGPRPVRLHWVAASRRFEGRLRRVEVVPGPIEVSLFTSGVRLVGFVEITVVAPAVDVHIVEPTVHVVHHGKHKHKHRRKHRRHRHGHEYRVRIH